MGKKEYGMTLVEVLVTLILLMLMTGIIWTTILITSRFNIAETSTLRLQQEANYIITTLQQVHRQCFTYSLFITNSEIKIKNCVNDQGEEQNTYNGVISKGFTYQPLIDDELIRSTERNVDLTSFKVTVPVSNRYIEVPTVISRYKTEKGDRQNGETK
ncbi:prepilin-type N-terminal cleavage/methylation domain-containing protein [Sporosarcina sp. YIM B06819]|uniref:PilW family protein n=1 Tax=Sporosarcina sp. YIM B06819 TaxID=3081769 RepID=UPI00298CE871|nr:prepilin-type N-terminal cleavage/methylation domain-containing protein [Sporosarcina sp. YIM B06819]